MTKLPMHEDFPFDEVTAPSLVSTGELPTSEQVRDVVTEAYEHFRLNGDGAVAQTTSSTTARSARQVDLGAACTATTIRPGRCSRSATVAARMLEPVARPS